jgi:putative FmdB family regulatory protein
VPTYQYSCTECGQQLDAVQSFADRALTDCPACQGRLRKVFNSVGIVFKGSGFYRTDSRAAAGGEPANAGASGKADAGSGAADSSSKNGAATSDTSSSTSSTSSSGSSNGTSSSSNSAAKSGAPKSGAAAASS